MGAGGLAGLGLLALGAARLGAPWGEAAPLHLALMDGLGTGVLAVFAIVGRFHTGRSLGLSPLTKSAFVALTAATLLRALPEMSLAPWPLVRRLPLVAARLLACIVGSDRGE